MDRSDVTTKSEGLWLGSIIGVALAILVFVIIFTLSLNNRVDRQRDYLCAHFEDADATLRDCPWVPNPNLADDTARRIKRLEEELVKLKGGTP